MTEPALKTEHYMIGSQKQIAWAKQIRNDLLDRENIAPYVYKFSPYLREAAWWINNIQESSDIAFWKTLTYERASNDNDIYRNERLLRNKIVQSPLIGPEATSELKAAIERTMVAGLATTIDSAVSLIVSRWQEALDRSAKKM